MAQADRQMAYFPKVANLTPISRNRALHFMNLAVRVGTMVGQARVTGRIG